MQLVKLQQLYRTFTPGGHPQPKPGISQRTFTISITNLSVRVSFLRPSDHLKYLPITQFHNNCRTDYTLVPWPKSVSLWCVLMCSALSHQSQKCQLTTTIDISMDATRGPKVNAITDQQWCGNRRIWHTRSGDDVGRNCLQWRSRFETDKEEVETNDVEIITTRRSQSRPTKYRRKKKLKPVGYAYLATLTSCTVARS